MFSLGIVGWRGKLRRYGISMCVVCVGVLVVQFSSYSIGVRAHIEIGLEAIKKYVLDWEEQYPGVAELFKDVDVYHAFYAGCAFPDWGYGGINPDASEASHWNRFMSSYVEVLREKKGNMSSGEFRKELAFFLGVVVHNISDIPWHFDDEGNESFITSARKYGGSSHQDSEMATDIFLFVEKELPYPITLPLYWPYDTIMETFRRCGIEVREEQVKAGCTREQSYLYTGPLIGMVGYQKMKSEHKWVYEHCYDYYYGGIEHCASAVSSFMKYYYALIMGDVFIQRSLDYSPYVRRNNDFVPIGGIDDKTVGEGLSFGGSENDGYLVLSNRNGEKKGILVRLGVPENVGEFRRASLWLYLSEVVYQNDQRNKARVAVVVVDNKDVEVVGGGVLSEVKEGDKVCFDIPIRLGWVRIDLSKFLGRWGERRIGESVIYITFLGNEELCLKFYSSRAFKRGEGKYCKGDLVAYRPVFIIAKE